MAGRGINKVILVGNLGADPEVRYTNGGVAIANLRVATSDSWRNKESGEKQERTEWHRVVMFQRLAEIAQEYLKKGQRVYVEGRIQTRKWQDQQGNDRYSTEIVANEMLMLGGRDDMGQGAGGPPEHSSKPPRQSQPPAAAAPAAAESTGVAEADFDDDIPF